MKFNLLGGSDPEGGRKLPASDQVVIEVAKLRDYLLSFAHPVGRFKAAFFAAHGYTADNWRQLEADLRRLVEDRMSTRANPAGMARNTKSVVL